MMNGLARECIQKRKDYIPGKPIEEVQKEYGLTDVIKMASNENPLGTSPKAVEAMCEEIRTNANRYPVSLCTALTEKLAAYLNVKPEQLYIDNGGDGVITMIGLTFLSPEDEVVTSELTFPAYENIAAKMGAHFVTVPTKADGGYDMEALRKAITPKTKMVFLCNPNNPTGTIIGNGELAKFLTSLPSSVVVVMDEAYYEFADNPDYPQTVPMLKDYPNMLIIRTFSKVMGLAGVRCGYIITHPDTVRMLLKAREPFPVNRVAQVGAIASLDDTEFRDATVKNNKLGREQFYRGLEEMGLEYAPSQTNFIYVNLRADAQKIFHEMLKQGVIIRPLDSQGRPECVRISIGLPEENARTLKALKTALSIVK